MTAGPPAPDDTLPCPICKRPVPIPPRGGVDTSASSSNDAVKYFPFCTERCKLVDLGRWLDGKYQIPVTEADEDDDME